MSGREHMAAEPQTIGAAVDLVYCMACGYLLATPEGSRPIADRPCTPAQVGFRWGFR